MSRNGRVHHPDLRPTPLLPPGFSVPATRWEHPSSRLRALLDSQPFVFAPGMYDPFTAQQAMYYEYPAVYFSGYSFAMGHLGSTDMDLYGNAFNVARTTELYVQAGIAACDLEDQVLPKRCGHIAGKAVIP